MKFNGITKKGREYLAKIQAENKPINFVKIKIGDGRLDNYDNPAELEHLINQKVEKGILTLNQEHDTVILTTNIDNVSLRTGYYPREIGVFVNDNGQEIMYYYMNDGDETSWIPPETDGPFKIELKLNLIASNAQSIIVEGVGKDLFITKEFLETNYTQKGGYMGTAQEIDDRVVSALGKEDGEFPLTEAVKGNVYYFPGNKKFYICKEAQNRRVSVPDGNFEELSIWENRKRLENLSKYESVNKTAGTRYSALVFSKIGKTAHVFLDIPSGVSNTLNEGTLLFTFPNGYKPKTFNLKLIVSHPSGRTARTRYDANTGNLYILTKLDTAESMYLDTFYFLD